MNRTLLLAMSDFCVAYSLSTGHLSRPVSPLPDALSGLTHPINRRLATCRPVLFGTLCEGIEIPCHPKHPGRGLWPERVSLIGHPAQRLRAVAPVCCIVDDQSS
jgi:hypothetical protein